MIKTALGCFDILPDEAKFWRIFQDKAYKIFSLYGYNEIFTPYFEQTDLFVRGIGEATDVVSKEMFRVISGGNLEKVFSGQKIKAKSNLSLRPEGTAGVVRSVIEHNMVPMGAAPVKLMYAGPMFRGERPSAGRQRQFMQVGVECIGTDNSSVDAEAIIMLMKFYNELGFDVNKHINLVINSMGCKTCRDKYRKDLQVYLNSINEDLCEVCKERSKTNPLRTLDCKREACIKALENAPKISDYLCDDCKKHFEDVKYYLDQAKVNYSIDSHLVRGLDYYTRTVFEVRTNLVGAQDALAGGGRYDGLVEQLGGSNLPGFGFALGYERTLLALKNLGLEFEPANACDYFIAKVDKSVEKNVFEIAEILRNAGAIAQYDQQNRSLKSQFKLADKLHSKYTVIVGPDEIKNKSVSIRDMKTHEQIVLDIDKLYAHVADKL